MARSGAGTTARRRCWLASALHQGLYEGSHYQRTPEAGGPELSWLFDGVDGEVFGQYGLFGGGAAGFELDQVAQALGTPPGTVIVARSEGAWSELPTGARGNPDPYPGTDH